MSSYCVVPFDFLAGGDGNGGDDDDDMPCPTDGLCWPDDPIDEVMKCLSVIDEPLLHALKLNCSPSLPPPAADSGGGNTSRRESNAPAANDAQWFKASTAARKPRNPPTIVNKRVWSMDRPTLPVAVSNIRRELSSPCAAAVVADTVTIDNVHCESASPCAATIVNTVVVVHDDDSHHREEAFIGGGGGGGENSRRPTAKRRRKRKCGEEKRCGHCEATETPQWRAGPNGPSTLCNACGIRYRMDGRLLPEYRPSTSPGFGSEEYSNRHRKVVKLREKKQKEGKVISGEAVMVPAMAAPNAGEIMDQCAIVNISS
uniref:GATA-type domain-containing protein n=1 Tax=Leersia perrieri TaxID=77586 RepID=A0A0D9VP43_9ORYZ